MKRAKFEISLWLSFFIFFLTCKSQEIWRVEREERRGENRREKKVAYNFVCNSSRQWAKIWLLESNLRTTLNSSQTYFFIKIPASYSRLSASSSSLSSSSLICLNILLEKMFFFLHFLLSTLKFKNLEKQELNLKLASF